MSDLKIHIYFDFKVTPWGGGNQFLKALRKIYVESGVYTDTPEDANIILVNSHHFGDLENFKRLISLKQNNPNLTIIHRIDGPVTKIRQRDDGVDKFIFRFNKFFSNGNIIQSNWCLKNCVSLGLENNAPSTIIFNAPDPDIFFPSEQKTGQKTDQKIRIIATSWSSNKIKGFDDYEWMDQNIDWSRYEMIFVGNSDRQFKNIKIIPPVKSDELGGILREHDIFITASNCDPCSNSLIEALHTKLPALVKNDGGHPELVGEGGLFFNAQEEIPAALDQISSNLALYSDNINLPCIRAVSKTYYDFMVQCHDTKGEIHNPNTPNLEKQYKKLIAPKLKSRIIKFIRSF